MLRGTRPSGFMEGQTEPVADVVITRPAATSLFCIDSDDRYQNYGQRRSNPSYPFSFSINKNEALLNGFFNRMALSEFRLNWTLPNISSAWGNNQIVINTGASAGGPFTANTITIPDGFYGAEELAVALQGAIRQAPINLTEMIVTVSDAADDTFRFNNLLGTQFFYFSPVTATASIRQLFDMINLPTTTTGVKSMLSGIPNLRPMDYFDIVCNQLTYNQDLKDSTSAPIVRDMVSRIYLDDAVNSQAVYTTNNYAGRNVVTLIAGSITGVTASGNIAIFTITTELPEGQVVPGQFAVISGVTGNTAYNGTGRVVSVDSTAPGFSVQIELNTYPTTTAAVTTSATISFIEFLDTFSTPQTSWDDRVNGVTPFVLYRQFPYPKQIRWNKKQPIGQVVFELYDDQGRSIQDLWNSAYPISTNQGRAYANSFVWNMSLLVTED